jgi:hypothetical protein
VPKVIVKNYKIMPSFEIPDNTIKKSEAEIKNEKEDRKKRIIALAKELSESRESISFPGIDAESYQKLKANDEEFPGFVTPIDELVQRFENEGIKVVFGRDPESGNVFILPFGSNDVENDSIFPKHLQIDESMDSRLKELILASRS